MRPAISRASALVLQNFTPPLKPSVKVPLPRPPAWIWDFTIVGPSGSWARAVVKSAAEVAADALGHRHAEFFAEGFCLILVNVHGIGKDRILGESSAEDMRKWGGGDVRSDREPAYTSVAMRPRRSRIYPYPACGEVLRIR